MKKESATSVVEQSRLHVSWLIEIKLRGQLIIERTNSNGKEERGIAWLILWATILDLSINVIVGSVLFVELKWVNKD